MGAFFPPTYMLKRVSPFSKKNGSKSSCMDILFKKGSPKSSRTASLRTLLPLKEVISYEDDEVSEEEDGLNPFDLPPNFGDCDDKGALNFKELGETLVPSSFCDEEELACKEVHLPLYKGVCFQQEHKVEATRDLYSLAFLMSFMCSIIFNPFTLGH